MCDVVGNATINYPKLPHIKNVISITFPNPNILEVHVTLPEYAKKNKTLHTNRPCVLCDKYVHYSHHYPCLKYFYDTLQVHRELDVARSDSTSPPGTSFGLTAFPEHEVSQPAIVIPPPNIEMTDCFTPILYLSSSMGSINSNYLGVSYCSFEPTLEDTSVSTPVHVTSTSHPSRCACEPCLS